MNKIITFTSNSKPYGYLSNMYPMKVKMGSRLYQTAEHLFQAMRFDDERIINEIAAEPNPMKAKAIAKQYSDKCCILPLSSQDVENMKRVIWAKIKSNPDLQELLIKCKEKIIIEDVTARMNKGNNMFWGAAVIDGKWSGMNTLGRIWMASIKKWFESSLF